MVKRIALIVSILFTVWSCQKEELQRGNKRFIFTLSMPNSTAVPQSETRLNLSETSEGNIDVKWKSGDKISLCFLSEDNSVREVMTNVPVTNISPNGKEGRFEVEIPEWVEGKFSLYGVFGAQFKSGESEVIILPETESSSGELSSIGDRFAMDFILNNVEPTGGVVDVSFRYIGAIMAIYLTNGSTASTSLSSLVIESDNYSWLDNIPGGAQYNWRTETLTYKNSAKKLSFIKSGTTTLAKGATKTIYRWIVPTSDFEPNNRLNINVNGTLLQESIPAINMLPGRYYALNLLYDGHDWRALPFGATVAERLPHDTNCHLITPPSVPGTSARYLMPISRINQFWGYSTYGNGMKVIDPHSKWVANIIWKDVDLDDGVELISLVEDGSRGVGPDSFVEFEIKYDAEERYGNALIGVRRADDNFNPIGDYLWSWHIWISDYSGKLFDVSAGEGSKIMDRNLGARSNIIGDPSTMGLLYQWGRKDPLVSGNYEYWLGGGSNTFIPTTLEGTWSSKRTPYTIGGTVGWAVENPTSFIRGEDDAGGSTYNGSNWLKSSSATLWSQTEKTLFDPCPKGFKVAHNGTVASSYAALNEENLKRYPTSSPNGRLYGADLWFPTTGYLTAATGALNGVRTRCYLGSGGAATSSATNAETGQKSHYVRTLSLSTSTTDPMTAYYVNVKRATAMGMRCIEWLDDK